MATPKRYNYIESKGVEGIGWINEDLKGIFVTYEDYLKLQKEFFETQKKLTKNVKKNSIEWKRKKMYND